MSGGLRKCMVLVVLGILVQWADKKCEGQTLEMPMIYRYSEEIKALKGGQGAADDWPRRGDVAENDWRTGTLEQHEHLMRRDRMRHVARRRGLLSASSLSPTNETVNIDQLGGLHYSFITLGTPNQTFLVALDTGSDLLWVPCNCQQCSPTNWANYNVQSQGLQFSVYNESSSSTSKYLPCTDSLCSSTLKSTGSCTSANDKCSYIVEYMSTDTSTSGVIVEDLLYLNYEESNGGTTSTPIYFGCGQLQTGDLVEGVAPNGLFGLGPDHISVPSTLARNGVVSSNSFSMCFSSSDASGRLVFGIEAESGLPSTPLVPITPSVYYVVSTTKFSFGGGSISVSDKLIFDTGTSYTTLPQSTYQILGDMLNKEISLPQFQLNGTFDYCWNTSDPNIINSLPTLGITFSGGSTWNIVTPFVTFINSRGNIQFFCLGVTPTSSTGIIGHNFMGGYEFFFNQDLMTFSWSPSTCYVLNASAAPSPRGEPSIVNRASTQSSSSHSHRAALYNRSILSFHLFCFFLAFILFI